MFGRLIIPHIPDKIPWLHRTILGTKISVNCGPIKIYKGTYANSFTYWQKSHHNLLSVMQKDLTQGFLEEKDE